MADAVQKAIPKPQLRGLLRSHFKKHAIIGSIFCLISVTLFKHFIVDERRRKYAEYNKTYDGRAEFERMRKLGLLQSAKP